MEDFTIQLSNTSVPVHIQRSRKRKRTLTFKVEDVRIVVQAPQATPLAEIRRILLQKQPWLEQVIRARQEQAVDTQDPWYERLTILGRPTEVKFHADAGAHPWSIREEQGILHVFGDVSNRTVPALRAAVVQWLKGLAKVYLTNRTTEFAATLDLPYNVIRIKELKSRWGSCSTKGNLNYNWRLIFAPPFVVDYVVIHELCHLREMNHSRRFWAHVEQAMPNFQEAVDWLRKYGSTLYL